MKYTAVIFDMDGTLLNTLGDLAASVNYALEKCGYPPRTQNEVMSFVGSGVERLVRLSVPEGTGESETLSCLDIFREHYSENSRVRTMPYEGILPLLSQLRSMGVKLSTASNKFQGAVTELCADYFPGMLDAAVGEKPGVPKKPAPDCVFECMRLMGSSKRNTLYVGDSDVDIRTAQNASLDCIGVLWGFRSREELEAAGARRFAFTPSDILDAIVE